jgi:ribosomal protein L2
LPLNILEPGQLVHCIQPTFYQKAKYVRSGGNAAKILSITPFNFLIRLRSRYVFKSKRAFNVVLGTILELPKTTYTKASITRLQG